MGGEGLLSALFIRMVVWRGCLGGEGQIAMSLNGLFYLLRLRLSTIRPYLGDGFVLANNLMEIHPQYVHGHQTNLAAKAECKS